MKLKSSLPAELKYQAVVIEQAAREAGLDSFEVEFVLLSAADVNGVAAYGGFPVRYPSWRFGMEFERLQKGYRWGLSKIYELVINNDPTIAYLVSSNSLMEQKLVMAHVHGHGDFFKHNIWFAPTNRRMVDQMGHHATRMRRYIDVHGIEAVERFIDNGLCLETLIDPFLPLRRMGSKPPPQVRQEPLSARALRSMEAMSGTASQPEEAPAPAPTPRSEQTPPTHDVMGFLVERAPLDDWQRDLLRMLRDEAYYFAPQRMTKIANEGWATFWHSRLLTERGILDDSEILDFADTHAGATATSGSTLNPYKLGSDLFRYAESRGEDLFRLRRVHNDVSLVDELIDERFVEFTLSPEVARHHPGVMKELDWESRKKRLLQELSWGGLPKIGLIEDDDDGDGGLVLVHHHDGRDLQLAQAAETLRHLQSIWKADVSLYTLEEGQGRKLVCDDEGVEALDTVEARALCAPEREFEEPQAEEPERKNAV